MIKIAVSLTLVVALSGCTAAKIITAPVRAAGTVVETAVDATTQTQSEKEEDLGRKIYKKYRQCLKEADSRDEERECAERYEIDD